MRYKDEKKYKIKDKERFRELYYFALQYNVWRTRLAELKVVSSPNLDGMPRGSGVGDPTGSTGSEVAELMKKISLIEDCVREAGPDIYRGLLKGVTTQSCTPNWLRARGYIYCGNDKYYHSRAKFYWLLNQRKG